MVVSRRWRRWHRQRVQSWRSPHPDPAEERGCHRSRDSRCSSPWRVRQRGAGRHSHRALPGPRPRPARRRSLIGQPDAHGSCGAHITIGHTPALAGTGCCHPEPGPGSGDFPHPTHRQAWNPSISGNSHLAPPLLIQGSDWRLPGGGSPIRGTTAASHQEGRHPREAAFSISTAAPIAPLRRLSSGVHRRGSGSRGTG